MPIAILTTKLYAPPLRPTLVSRPRLVQHIHEGLYRSLTLISAPAGFGKTTLVSEWLAAYKQPVAWLSLAQEDGDVPRFLAYLIAALQTVVPDIGVGVVELLQSPQPPPTESILSALLNEITTTPDKFVLVLDDYHLLDAQPVDQALAFLLEHLPPQMHLIITTREDPPLPLARYRVRDQLTEVRAADLRFSDAEATEFLNQIMGLSLSADAVAALETRTEGWIAGLQMAALSIQSRDDTPSFIEAFTGSHRFVLDYLAEEVLQRQPQHVRNFLLHTAILKQLNAPLCNAVTEAEDGQQMLTTLERGNLFVVPLDDKRQWYRYHHLFADVLHARLLEGQPSQIPTLHRRASIWYEENDLRADAIHHALAAADFERAAALIEWERATQGGGPSSATWLGWVKVLPDDLVRNRPILSVGYAWALLGSNELVAGEARLQDAERWLDITDGIIKQGENTKQGESTRQGGMIEASEKIVVVDEAQLRHLPASVATARAYIAQALGRLPDSVMYAQQALALLPESNISERMVPAMLIGIGHWAGGDLALAYETFTDIMTRCQAASKTLLAIGFASFLAELRMAQGQLRAAIRAYEHALSLAGKQSEPLFPGLAELYAGLSEVHSEQGNGESAAHHLDRSEALAEQSIIVGNEYRLYPMMARTKAAMGDLESALDLLDEAERLYYKTPIPIVRPFAAQKARIWIVQGRLSEALNWVHEQSLSVDDNLNYLREFEHITLARVLLAQWKSERRDSYSPDVLKFLARLLPAAEAGERRGSVIEILMLQALVYEAQGDIPAALNPLGRALALAEPEGYVRMFIAEGLPMTQLLREAVKREMAPNYSNKLLAAFTHDHESSADTPSPPLPLSLQPLVEPLSQRELEVLQLIAQGLSNREIGERLFLALDTVKGHNRRIFGKLQVQRRTEAIARARELNLL